MGRSMIARRNIVRVQFSFNKLFMGEIIELKKDNIRMKNELQMEIENQGTTENTLNSEKSPKEA